MYLIHIVVLVSGTAQWFSCRFTTGLATFSCTPPPKKVNAPLFSLKLVFPNHFYRFWLNLFSNSLFYFWANVSSLHQKNTQTFFICQIRIFIAIYLKWWYIFWDYFTISMCFDLQLKPPGLMAWRTWLGVECLSFCQLSIVTSTHPDPVLSPSQPPTTAELADSYLTQRYLSKLNAATSG